MMKIKRFNESVKGLLDPDYLNSCFIDLIDSNVCSTFKVVEYNVYECKVKIEDNYKRDISSTDVNSILSDIKSLEEQYKNIKDSIDKVKIEYPNCLVIVSKQGSKVRVKIKDIARRTYNSVDTKVDTSYSKTSIKKNYNIPKFPDEWNM